jgi:hypothetical protein
MTVLRPVLLTKRLCPAEFCPSLVFTGCLMWLKLYKCDLILMNKKKGDKYVYIILHQFEES